MNKSKTSVEDFIYSTYGRFGTELKYTFGIGRFVIYKITVKKRFFSRKEYHLVEPITEVFIMGSNSNISSIEKARQEAIDFINYLDVPDAG